MKNTEIIIEWVENSKMYEKSVDRNDMYVIFDGLAKGYAKPKDNEISKKLLKIIPEVDKIFINKDRNKSCDVPFIAYHIGEEMNVIAIRRYHEIVWSILRKYCTE